MCLQAVIHNKCRHNELQCFMLLTDSMTVAVEVPVYLTPEDIWHLENDLGFKVPLPAPATLTGHIDVLRIRNGRVHILDYKPAAMHERPIAQLMVYTLALSRRTGLRLYDFVCAWFDNRHYFDSACVYAALVVFAGGTLVTKRPPPRCQRAVLPHWAPALKHPTGLHCSRQRIPTATPICSSTL